MLTHRQLNVLLTSFLISQLVDCQYPHSQTKENTSRLTQNKMGQFFEREKRKASLPYCVYSYHVGNLGSKFNRFFIGSFCIIQLSSSFSVVIKVKSFQFLEKALESSFIVCDSSPKIGPYSLFCHLIFH